MEQFLNVVRMSNNLCVTKVNRETRQITREKVKYKPTLYVKENRKNDVQFTNVYGSPVFPREFESMGDANKYIKQNKEIGVDVYGMEKFIVSFIKSTFKLDDFDRDLVRIFTIDIENKIRDKNGKVLPIDPFNTRTPITAITLHDSQTGIYHVFGNQVEWENNQDPKLDVKYEAHYCHDEQDLLEKLLKFWTSNYPDIITGWNTKRYDIPYIINRMILVLGETQTMKLSPWGKISERSYTDDYGNDLMDYTIFGISAMDYLEVYQKNIFTGRESFSLDFIAEYETGKGKIDYVALGYKDLDDLWERNPQLYITYNVRDVESVLQIEDKNKFFDIMISTAYYAGINFDDVFSGMRVIDAIIHNYLIDQNIVMSPSKKEDKVKFKGAYVKDIKPGLYKNVMSYDLNSLYPSIIRTLNLGVETLVDAKFPDQGIAPGDLIDDILNQSLDTSILKEYNLTLAANGQVFKNEKQSFLSKMMEVLYNKRVEDKQKMLHHLSEKERLKAAGEDYSYHEKEAVRYKNSQLVMKVVLNSTYGVLGNRFFRYYDLRLATAITYTGETIIKWSEKKINEYLNKILKTDDDYVVLIDTDSIVVDFNKLVEAACGEYEIAKVTNFLDKVGQQKIEPFLEKIYAELAEYLNSKDNQMVMKRENIASSMLAVAKKKYAMCVQDSEGVRYSYDDPYYKIMGIEIIKSNTPKKVRAGIKECLEIIMADCEDSELGEMVDKWKDMMYTIPAEELGVSQSVNELNKYADPQTIYKKGTTMQARASLLANKHYNAGIVGGQKIKHIPLKLPNPIGENVIAFTDKFYDDLREYVDYKEIFNKTFYSPVESLAEAAGKEADSSVVSIF